MANPTQALRKLPLDGRLGGGAGVSITPADPMSRISLRVKEKDVKAVGKALGVALPVKPKTSSTSSDAANTGRSALWIGPDEWLILDDETANLSGALAKAKAVISVVDISHRNTAILLEGPKAVEVLRSGCPQNLNDDVFPVGACSRTILGKAEVVIWRTDAQSYHIECWRSFSDYTFKFMVQAAKGL
jgi:sarcosine oxidase subunit gamma